MQIDQCVPEPRLAQFVNGELEEAELNLVAKHVDLCEPCQDTVVALAEQSNTFVETLRTAGEHASPHENALKLGLKRMLVSLRSSLRHVSDNDQADDPRGPSSIFALGDKSQDEAQKSPPMLGPYEVEKQLGQGGMGHVYRATHTKLKRTVALKILPASRWANSSAVSRFEREMEAIGVLDHPNIVRASDAGEDRGMHYLVMEYIDGLDLSRLGNRLGPLPVAEASELARQCAIGLHHAHENGLVHRDIKPSNLMVAKSKRDDSEVTLKILDLGLALLGDEHLQAGHELTTVGTLMGTLDYMSPEQGIDSHSVDQRTDIYSLGATLFKLLTGRAPYADPQYGTLMKKMTALATKQAPSVGSVRTDLPEDLVAVVDRMLSRDPDDRFESAEEVAEALAPFCNGANVSKLLRRADSLEDPPERVTPRFPVTAILGDETTNRTNQQPAELKSTKPSTVLPWHRVLIGLCFVAATALAGILFYISTDYGELKIQSDDPNATITVSKAGQEVEKLQIKNGEKRIWLRVGTYELKVDGEASVSIEPPSVAVRRRQAHAARVIQPATTTPVRPFDPYDPEANARQERRKKLFDEAESLAAKGELQEALRKYKQLDGYGFDPVATHARAKVLMKMGWYHEADRVLQRLGRSNNLNGLPEGEWLDYYSDQATCCMAIGEYQRAADTARKGLNSVGLTEPRLWFLYGDATERVAENSPYASDQEISERRNDASAAYRKTLQLDANHEQAKLKLQQLQARIEKEKADAAVFAEKEAKLKRLLEEVNAGERGHDGEFEALLAEVREQRSSNSSELAIIHPLTRLQIVVLGAPPDRPIAGLYGVEPDGYVNLGPGYGKVDVKSMTVDEAACVIRAHLEEYLVSVQVAVSFSDLSSNTKSATGISEAAAANSKPASLNDVSAFPSSEIEPSDLDADELTQKLRDSTRSAQLLEDAESLVEVGKHKEALEKYNEFFEKYVPTFRAAYGKAKVFRKLGWLDNTYAQLQRASTLIDGISAAERQQFIIEFATSARENDDYNTAIALITNQLNEDGLTDAELWYQLGIAKKDFASHQKYATTEQHQQQLGEALKVFQRSVQLDPEHGDAKSEIAKLNAMFKSQEAEDAKFREDVVRLYEVTKSGLFDEETKSLIERVRNGRKKRLASSRGFATSGSRLYIQVPTALPEAPINGTYPVDSRGGVQLGAPYGWVHVEWLTPEEATLAIEQHLSNFLKVPTATVSLAAGINPNSQTDAPTVATAASEATPIQLPFEFHLGTELPSQDGPIYKGHDYSYWLKSLRTDRDPEIQENAIEALGLLGEDRSLQAARAILEAMRTQAGSRVFEGNVIQALASLDPGMVIQAIRDEIKSGNHRSRQKVESFLGLMKSKSPDVTRLMEKIEEHSTELTKLRLENPRREERELKSNFFRLMLSKYSADPKLLREQIVDYHEELVLSPTATVELVKRAPDVPETWGLLPSRFPAENYHKVVNMLVADIEVEKLQHMGPRLTEILRSVEKPSDYGKFEAIISTLGKLEEHGKEAIPVLIKVAEAEGARDQAWGAYACIALAGIQKTVQDEELEQTLRELRKTWGPNGELNRAEWQKELRRLVIEGIDEATKAEAK